MDIINLAIIFVISISLHEYAHARASDKLGDPTPRLQWRLTPNPLVHIDLIGFLMIFLIRFGRWRPVIINPAYYKNPRRDELLVAVAWPITNVLLACAGIIIAQAYILLWGISVLQYSSDVVLQFWQLFSWINISLAIFNMLPFPPLDWYRVVSYLVPWFASFVSRWGMQMSIIVLLILITPNPISQFIRMGIVTITQTVFGFFWAFRWLVFL